MRRPFIAGNWKMNTSVDEAINLVKEMVGELDRIYTVDKVLCPPFISLQPVKDIIKGTSIELGAQNIYFKEKGAFTGEISPLMLKGLCKYVIIGHSERRQYFYETDALVNDKVRAALTAGLLPILCIGESPEENERGRTEEVLERQIINAIKDVVPDRQLVIAYEPIWAIGTGKAATGLQAGQTIGFIREILAQTWSQELAQTVRILYGGSVTGSNIAEFIQEPRIDGALVGGASLKAVEFISIIKQTASIKSAL